MPKARSPWVRQSRPDTVFPAERVRVVQRNRMLSARRACTQGDYHSTHVFPFPCTSSGDAQSYCVQPPVALLISPTDPLVITRGSVGGDLRPSRLMLSTLPLPSIATAIQRLPEDTKDWLRGDLEGKGFRL